MSNAYESYEFGEIYDDGRPLDAFDDFEPNRADQERLKEALAVAARARGDRTDAEFQSVGRLVGELAFDGKLPFTSDELKTYAPSPVWADSARKAVKFFPIDKTPSLSRKKALVIWRRANDFERQTRERGKQDGALGRNGLAVLRVLLFVFLNHKTGQLDPGQKSIALAAIVSERSTRRGLAKLKLAGVLNWIRRCTVQFVNGCAVLEQDTNAYGIVPPSQWRGYREPLPAPRPAPGTWGDHPCGMRNPHDEACEEIRLGGGTAAAIRQLALAERGSVAAALASLGRAAGWA